MKFSEEVLLAIAESDKPHPLVVAIKQKPYETLLIENFNSSTSGLLNISQPPRYIGGAMFFIAMDFEIPNDYEVWSLEEYRFHNSYNIMRHRLMTNGEWLAEGKPDRAKSLREEAEGFAEMVSGMERWKEMLERYLKEYPTPPVQ